jgi:hypothetical protein
MNYMLAIAATSRSPEDLEELLPSTIGRLHPGPSKLVIYDDGRGCEAEEMLRAGALHYGSASAVMIAGNRRPVADPLGRLWKLVAAQSEPFALVMSDGWRFVRSVTVTDAAYVLERQRQLRALRFVARGHEPVNLPMSRRRGSGAVAWITEETGLLETPTLIRTELARSFPWPKRGGAGELEAGVRASLPGSMFGMWGTGDPWVDLP